MRMRDGSEGNDDPLSVFTIEVSEMMDCSATACNPKDGWEIHVRAHVR